MTRSTLAAAIALACAACGGAPAAALKPAPPPLHLSPIEDLAPAAGIAWLVSARPRALASTPTLLPAIDTVLPQATLTRFAEKNGGVNPLEVDELAVATYDETTLWLTRGLVDPARVEAAFARRADPNEDRGRAIDARGAIVRVWGTVGGDREQLAVFGREGLGLEIGRFGPLRAAELFAEGRLKRASPALKGSALARAAELLGDAPLRAFAAGPFEGTSARMFAGLLGASTAAAIGARVAAAPTKDGMAALDVTLVLTGGWGDDAPKAAERLDAAFHTMSVTPLGRLLGLDQPIASARVQPQGDALRLTVTLDALALARGMHAATDAEIAEIMRY